MIVTFWLYAAALLDTPERRIRMEVRRMTEAETIKKSSCGH